jgi:hypothetical protein
VVNASVGAAPGMYHAGQRVVVRGGALLRGLVLAPSVHIEAGAVVEGSVLATIELTLAPGGRLVADAWAADSGWWAGARIHRLGRRGLLAFP